MSQTSQDLITDAVVSAAETWDNLTLDDWHDYLDGEGYDIDPLDVRLEVDIQGNVREVILVTGVGGPYIEVNVTNQTVFGNWGGDTHTTHFNNPELAEAIDEYYSRYFEENVVA